MNISPGEVLEILNSTSVDEIKRIVLQARVDHGMRKITLRQLCDVLEMACDRLIQLAEGKA
jgi:hypothetical protein